MPAHTHASLERVAHVVMLVRNPFTHDSRVEKEARTLLAAGYDVTVICEARPGLAEREVREGVRIVRVVRRHSWFPFVRFFSYRLDLLRALEAADPTILHAHDANALDEVGQLASRRGIPFVYDSHELWLGRTHHKHSRLYFKVTQLWHAFVERRYVARADAVLTVSPHIAAYLQKKYRLAVVHLVPNYPERPSSDECRDLRGLMGNDAIPREAPIVLHIGLYTKDRGIDQVIEALQWVPEAHLVLLGAGPRGPQAVRVAASYGVSARVHPLDPVPHDELISYAASATIGVAPIVPNSLSYTFALPNKLFQSMGAGIPVIVSDLPEMGPLVREAGAGLTVDGRDAQDIAAALKKLLANRELSRSMGRRGRAAVLARFNWDTSAHALLRAYAGLGSDARVQ